MTSEEPGYGFVKLFETEDAWTMKADLSAGEA
jgi:hypothetical protein